MVAFIATQLGTYFGYVFPAVGLPVLPWPLYNGILGTTFADGVNGVTATGAFDARLRHLGGVVLRRDSAPLRERHRVRDALRDPVPRVLPRFKRSNGGNISIGLLYAVIMSIISAGLLVPYAYVPNQGYGLFLFDGPDGWKLPFAILVWHLIYGFFLGALYQPTEVDIADEFAANDVVYYEETVVRD